MKVICIYTSMNIFSNEYSYKKNKKKDKKIIYLIAVGLFSCVVQYFSWM